MPDPSGRSNPVKRTGPSPSPRQGRTIKPRAPSQLDPSPLRPLVPAQDRLRLWHTPYGTFAINHLSSFVPNTTVDRWLEVLAASVEPSTRRNYGTGLLRFTQFCNRHNISETLRMPASELLLALFVAEEGAGHVSGGTIASWLSGLQLWHTFNNAAWAGGQVLRRTHTGASALAPLSSSRPPRPPVTLLLLRTLKSGLTLSNTRDAAIWAVACTAWRDCCRLGELVPPSKASFDPA